MTFRSKVKKFRHGFTLFEAVVTIGIFVALTGVVLLRYNSFQGSVLVINAAYDVALWIREAQVSAISVRPTTVSGSQNYTVGYGIQFDATEANNKRFIVFADIPPTGNTVGDGRYIPTDDQIVETVKVSSAMQIKRLCARDTNPTPTCFTASSSVQEMNIAFRRPDPNAGIRMFLNGISQGIDLGGLYSTAWIEIAPASQPESAKTIRVESTGQIAVCKKTYEDCI